jgi:hypothetical protein
MRNLIGLTLCLFSSLTFANSYVVEMEHKLSKLEIEELKSQGIKTIQSFTPYSSEYFDRLYSVEFDGKRAALTDLPNIKLVEDDFEADFFEIKANPNSERTTNDMLFPLQWGLQNQEQIIVKQKLKGGPEEIKGVLGADIGWKNAIKSIEKNLKRAPIVAVVDMGIDLNHPELVDQMYRNDAECDSDGNVPIGERVDRDGNKYAADCLGFNFAAVDPLNIQFPRDDKNHGTHVAGIIAAKMNNDTGVSGVSDRIKILPVKVTGRADETSDRDRMLMKAPSKRIANGILYAVKRKVDVINLSLGWPKSMDTAFMRNVIKEAVRNNIVVVAAAGNNNTNGNIFPCAYENVICVGSVDADGSVSSFSNYGGEVDILAPGDQILSTIPTEFIPIKMNIQGYDILSGTSQAAPFVSAAAALLKGVYPDMSIYEVMRRLYDSAGEKQDKFKSLHGLLNLGKAFKIKNAPSIKPIFKLNSEIVFSPINGEFDLLLPVRNYGADATNIKVELFFKDPRVRLNGNSITFDELPNYEKLVAQMTAESNAAGKPVADKSVVKFGGLISSKFIDKQTKFLVVIKYLDDDQKVIKVEQFEHEVTVSKQFLVPNANSERKLPFVFKDPSQKVPVGLWDNEEKKLRDNLRTVEDVFTGIEFPSYYVKYQATAQRGEVLDEADDGIKLYFFNHAGDKFLQAENDLFISKAVKLISVLRGDYNYDGKSDYLIKTIVKPESDDGYILYSYRDENLAPLVGKFSDIRYYPTIVNVTPDTVRLMKTVLANGQSLAVPYFIGTGALPDEDQIFDPWKPKDSSVLRRIYRLDVVVGEHVEFKARTQMNSKFVDIVKEKLKDSIAQTIALADTNVQIIQLLTQDANDYSHSTVKALVSVGLGYYRENALLTFNGLDFDVSVQENITERLEASAHHPVYSMESETLNTSAQNAFVSFLTDDLVTMTSVEGNSELSTSFRMRNENDRIMSFLALFQKGNVQTSVLETVDYIMMVESTGDVQKSLKRKVKKFSFLPGSRMSELYIPITILNRDGEMQPAIYVDATSLTGNNIYLLTKIGDELVAPVDMSLNIPSNCVAKNPLRTAQGNSKYSILCLTNDGFSMNYVDLEAP